jgi:hypothetical protein
VIVTPPDDGDPSVYPEEGTRSRTTDSEVAVSRLELSSSGLRSIVTEGWLAGIVMVPEAGRVVFEPGSVRL